MRVKKQMQDDAAILALACGATIEKAAQQAGIVKRTLYRRMKDPGFRARIQALRADMMQRQAGALTAAGTEAIKTLLDLLKPATIDSVRLGAARAVLESGAKFREMTDLEERMTTLEDQLVPNRTNFTEEDSDEASNTTGTHPGRSRPS